MRGAVRRQAVKGAVVLPWRATASVKMVHELGPAGGREATTWTSA